MGQTAPSAPAAPLRLSPQALAATAVLLITLLATLEGLWAEFVNWDDPANILDNPHIRGFSAARLSWMWSARHLGVYEPLAWMLKAAVFSVGGLRPGWYHAVSWLLHGLNAVLAFFLIRRLVGLATDASGRPADEPALWAAAGLSALFFSVHPQRVECVAWASAQPYLLSAAFVFASVLAYLHAARATTHRLAWLAAAWLLFVAALLSKAAAVTLPIVLLLLDIYPLGRIGRRAGPRRDSPARIGLEKLLFAAPAVAVAVAVATTPVTSAAAPDAISISQRILIAAQAIATTLWHVVVPVSLSPYYRLPGVVRASPALVVQLAAAVLVIAVALFGWPRRRGLACAAACFLVLLAPTLGFVRHGGQLTADRYSYLSTFSVAVLLAGLLTRVRPATLRLAAVGLIALSLMTWRQTSFWSDSESLWRRAIALDDGNHVAHNNLAAVLLQRGDIEAAERHVARALAAQPDYSDALLAQGMIAERENRLDDAIAAFRRALGRDPYHPAAANLGAALVRAGQPDEAEAVYRRALAADPGNRSILNNLAALHAARGQRGAAREIFTRLLADDPNDTGVLLNMALLSAAEGRPADAVAFFDRLLACDPANAAALYHRAAAMLALGRRDDAVRDFGRCIAADPDHVNARAELAVLLIEDGRDAEAVEHLDAAHRARPDDARVTNKLAWVLATSPDAVVRDPDRALALASELARTLRFANAQALDTLAAAQAAAGRFDDGVESAERAVSLARARGDGALAEAIAARLARYREKRPYVELRITPIGRPDGQASPP